MFTINHKVKDSRFLDLYDFSGKLFSNRQILSN